MEFWNFWTVDNLFSIKTQRSTKGGFIQHEAFWIEIKTVVLVFRMLIPFRCRISLCFPYIIYDYVIRIYESSSPPLRPPSYPPSVPSPSLLPSRGHLMAGSVATWPSLATATNDHFIANRGRSLVISWYHPSCHYTTILDRGCSLQYLHHAHMNKVVLFPKPGLPKLITLYTG